MNERNESHRDAFKAAVRLIDGQRRLLLDVEAREDIVQALSAIVRHLHRLPSNQIDRLYGIGPTDTARARLDSAVKAAESLSLFEIEHIIDREDIARFELEAIAIGRFHVPRGSMRSIGNLDRLREKIRTFVENEKTHVTITEVAKNSR